MLDQDGTSVMYRQDSPKRFRRVSTRNSVALIRAERQADVMTRARTLAACVAVGAILGSTLSVSGQTSDPQSGDGS